MKIGMLADIYKPHISGVTRYIEENRRILESFGHEVLVFTFGNKNLPDESGVVRSSGLPLTKAGLYLNVRYSRKAKRLLQEMDVVHCHHPFISGSLAVRYCRAVSIPIVFTNHTRYDLYFKSYLPAVPDLLGDAILQYFLPAFCRSIDAVIAPASSIKEVLEEMGVDVPIRVIPNGVDLTCFSGRVKPLARSDFGFTSTDFIFVYVGRLAPEKNLMVLLQAFSQAAAADPRTRLLLVGTGPQQTALQAAAAAMGISDRVRFEGLLEYVQIPGVLVMCDCFITASLTEVHPLSVIEAMACRLPVVAVDSPGISDIVIDGVNGFLSTHDVYDFSARMLCLLLDNSIREELADGTRDTVRCFDINITARKLENLYQELYTSSRPERRGLKHDFRRVVERLRS